MKKILSGIMIILFLVACNQTGQGQSEEENAKEEVEQHTQSEQDESIEQKDESNKPTQEKSSAKETSDDPYNHFNNATWNDNFHGLKSKILKVVTSNDIEIKSKKQSLVGIKLQVENTTDEEFIYRPAYGTLVLSTGEQIKMADGYKPAEINGDIYEGVKITSNINFLVESNVNDIEWVKFIWHVGQTGDDNVYDIEKEYEVKLELNK